MRAFSVRPFLSCLPLLAAAALPAFAAWPEAPPSRATPAAPARPAPPHVLLAAIGDEQPVFDRFVADLAQRLEGFDVASLQTASASGRVGRKLDTPADVHDAIRSMRGGRPGGCLVYLTGHGTRAGLALPLRAGSASAPGRAYAALDPARLAAALRQGCGEAPTVVVLSACYSGVYLRPGMSGPNRIMLTAAAPNRTSFGCSNDETHTYYDGCFLHSLDAAGTWRQLAARTAACVAGLERELEGTRPSRPQASFGLAVRDLSLPAPRLARPWRGGSGPAWHVTLRGSRHRSGTLPPACRTPAAASLGQLAVSPPGGSCTVPRRRSPA